MIHTVYCFLGICFCKISLLLWTVRDRLRPPETDVILFVAHPDDEVMFFHSFIKMNKPYIVVLFTGWSIRRFVDFLKVMKYYGVRYRIYPTESKDAYLDSKRTRVVSRHIKKCLEISSFKTVVTHNSNGEYGHQSHILVHESVLKMTEQKGYNVLCPVDASSIEGHPLSEENMREKKYIFTSLYKSESWVMDDYDAGTPVWFYNEKLEKVN